MLLPTHLAITTIVAKRMRLSGANLAYALLFGVGIDLDHYLRPSRFKDPNFWRSDGTHCDHTWLHEPFGLLVVALFSLWVKNPVPLLFYGIHFFIDQFILRALNKPFAPFSDKTYLYGLIPSGSKAEWLLAPFLLAGSLAYLVDLRRLMP